MKIYYYKGFKFYKGNSFYGTYFIIKNNEQLAPNDSEQPMTVRECKALINQWLSTPKKSN